MERLNLTIDEGLFADLRKLAKAEKVGIAGAARRLLQEALDHRRRLILKQAMASAYAAGAGDPEERKVLHEMQTGQDELLEGEE